MLSTSKQTPDYRNLTIQNTVCALTATSGIQVSLNGACPLASLLNITQQAKIVEEIVYISVVVSFVAVAVEIDAVVA